MLTRIMEHRIYVAPQFSDITMAVCFKECLHQGRSTSHYQVDNPTFHPDGAVLKYGKFSLKYKNLLLWMKQLDK